MIEYQGVYTDSSGEDPAAVHFDVTTIGFTTRGVEFMGGPDGYVTDLLPGSPELASFSFVNIRRADAATDAGAMTGGMLLAGFKLCWSMPVAVVAHGREYPGELSVVYHLLDPGSDRANQSGPHAITNLIDLTIFYSYQKYRITSGGNFEDVLNYLIAAMGHDVHMRACIACAYSDYPVAGHGCYGSMFCFRNLKGAYRRLQQGSVFDLESYALLPHAPEVLTVGELYVCPEFEPRAPGTGYRGGWLGGVCRE